MLVTIERLEQAIKTTAQAMVDYPDLVRQIRPTLVRLFYARADLIKDGEAIEFARRILKESDDVQRLIGNSDPNQPSAPRASL